jgi:WD40 repeat protein
VGIFAEHTNAVNSVKWNNNNRDEFASVSEDGLCKIWDRRSSAKTSVNTLMDRQSPGALRCCDWHKRDDWLLAVGNANEQVVIWDTRNSLQPLLRRYAHGNAKKRSKAVHAVGDVRFDSRDVNRFITASEDHTVRVWTTRDPGTEAESNGIFLINEHQIHRAGVKSVDWNVFDPDLISSGGADCSIVSCSLRTITQVKEYRNLKGELVVILIFYSNLVNRQKKWFQIDQKDLCPNCDLESLILESSLINVNHAKTMDLQYM